ncbi:hypothetical protein PsYK624_159850 [Phanerochaete sordida]|uniref:Uncharacterized protein n=1 Tax=Phanerochaete sordida TaxID=48140 RepID=A0A9P3LMH8_9APHY|nr:hypothetical protein PsYK624_159850 [Phanerochaete sordida]
MRHEWDVSLLFDPDDESHNDSSFEGWDQLVPNFDDDDFADIDDDDFAFDEPDGDRAGGESRSGTRNALAGDGLLLWRPDEHGAQRVDPEPESLLDVLAARYGVRVDLPYVPVDREDGERLLREPTVLRMLAHMTAAGVFNGPELPAICDFVTGISDGSPAPQLSDLSKENHRYQALKHNAGAYIAAKFGGTYVMKTADGGRRRGWLLTVCSATTALETVRRGWDPDQDGTVEEMIRRGIAFSTLARSSRPPSSAGAPAIPNRAEGGWSGLGYREPDYRPTPLDYGLYERQRRAVLGRLHGRAALMRGGIVWRLAYEDVDLQRVLLGPSDSSQKHVQLLGDVAHEDDTLSEEELFAICGVYRIYANDKDRSASDSSWWPKDSTWRESGMDVGYWTRQNEEWFVTRRNLLEDAVRTGDTAALKLRTAQQWRKALRYEAKRSRNFHAEIEALAEAVICQ